MTPGPAAPAPLPVDDHVPLVAAALEAHGAAILLAPAGTGKTTRVPWALARAGRVILLEPRRVAARAIARRIASEQGLTPGREIGWQVRFERVEGPETRLLVATEGILTARLQADPLLGAFDCVVLDEFHERSLHGDLALALVKEARRARQALRLLVMSATLDAEPVARYLGGAPILEVPGSMHPVTVEHAPALAPAAAVLRALRRSPGHVLAFLPGLADIRRVAGELAAAGLEREAVTVLPLHGSLGAEEQDRALAPSRARKVILATNIAETSLTVEGVREVVDTGLMRVLRYDPATAIDRLETERIPADSAAQRAGRAGRTAPGRVTRLWDGRERLRPARDSDIRRVDLAGPLLEVLAWGGDPLGFDWLEPPPAERVQAALGLLERLGAVAHGRLTRLGEELRRLPLHPRLARVLLAVPAPALGQAARACAILSERDFLRDPGALSAPSDVLVRMDRLGEAPASIRTAARELERLARRLRRGGDGGPDGAGAAAGPPADAALLRALYLGFPDRVARRREPGSPRLLLASGTGAVLARESAVHDAQWLVALALEGSDRAGSEALVRLASAVERPWLEPTGHETTQSLDAASGRVIAVERSLYGALVLGERRVPPDPARARELLVAALEERGLSPEDESLVRRLRFAGLAGSRREVLERAAEGALSLDQVSLAAHLPPATRRSLERLAPATLRVPSGKQRPLAYREDGSVVLPVKLQELFGLAATPRIGPREEPVLLELQAPSGRPIQTTRDLRSFWERTYPEVRRELRGRYPRHPWPEDPWTAPPTAGAKRRGPRSGC